jgi:hypothetical protein
MFKKINKKKPEKKSDIDTKALLEKYGNDKSLDFEKLIKVMVSKPASNTSIKIVKK